MMDPYLNMIVASVTSCYGSYDKNNTECVSCVIHTLCKLKLAQSEHPSSDTQLPNTPVKSDGGEALDDIFAQLKEIDLPF